MFFVCVRERENKREEKERQVDDNGACNNT